MNYSRWATVKSDEYLGLLIGAAIIMNSIVIGFASNSFFGYYSIGIAVGYFFLGLIAIFGPLEIVKKELISKEINADEMMGRFVIIQILISLFFISIFLLVSNDDICKTAIGWILLSLLGFILLPFHAEDHTYKIIIGILSVLAIAIPVFINVYYEIAIMDDLQAISTSAGSTGIHWSSTFS